MKLHFFLILEHCEIVIFTYIVEDFSIFFSFVLLFHFRLQNLSDYGVSLMVLMALGFLPSGFIAYLIRERRREEKQVQMVIGVSKMTYWFATAFYDFLVCQSY